MKLTKRERYSFYKHALKRIEKRVDTFICVAINRSAFEKDIRIWTPDVPDSFPELKKREPRKHFLDNWWWKPTNRSIRIRVLNKCIAETSPKTKK